MTPIKVIRKYCLFCTNNQYKEIDLCPDKKCALWKYRYGYRKKEYKYKQTPCRAIQKKCQDCTGSKKTRDCEFTKCALYSHRQAKNPNCSILYKIAKAWNKTCDSS